MGSSIIPKCGSNYFIPGVVGPFVKMKGSDSLYFVTADHVITQRLVHSGTLAGSQAYVLLYGAGKACRCGRVFAGGLTWNRAALVKVSDNLVPSRESFLKHVGSRYAGLQIDIFISSDAFFSVLICNLFVIINKRSVDARHQSRRKMMYI